jgi:hypothetical protein
MGARRAARRRAAFRRRARGRCASTDQARRRAARRSARRAADAPAARIGDRHNATSFGRTRAARAAAALARVFFAGEAGATRVHRAPHARGQTERCSGVGGRPHEKT